MVAVPLIFGRLTAADYEDGVARDPRIDELRSKMRCARTPVHAGILRCRQALHRQRRAGVLQDGSSTPRVAVDIPIGHRKRRAEGMPVLVKKFEASVAAHFPPKQTESIKALFADRAKLEQMSVQEFVAGLVRN